MHQQAWSTFDIKSLDEDRRIIEGIASTPTTDRQDDVVESLGASYKLPLPFMWQHGTDPFVGKTPVGHLIAASPTKTGIPVRIQMERSDRPGRLKDILDFAWEAVQKRLVRGLSIGFKPLGDTEPIKGTFGIRIPKWEWLELSAVTIPANADASILSIKHFDVGLPATGTEAERRRSPSPGVSGTSRVVSTRQDRNMKKTITDRIKDFEATRQAKSARMDEILDQSSEKGETLDAAQKEEYDGLDADVKALDEHLTRERAAEARQKAAATAVSGDTQAHATASRAGVIVLKPTVEKGAAFTRYAMALAAARGSRLEAAEYAKRWDGSTPEVGLVLKAAVSAGTTTDSDWAAPLVVYQNMANEFIELLRPATIIGRIPGLRRVPFNISMPTQTQGATAGWVGQGAPKPVSELKFGTLSLGMAKAAGIVVLSEELVRSSSPSAEAIVRQDLIATIGAFLDRQFIDPSVAAVTNVSPASITNGVTPVGSSGTNFAALQTDVAALFAVFTAANLSIAGAVWIMTETRAQALSMMLNALGQPSVPGISMTGGTMFGLPVITSENVVLSGGSPEGGMIILAKPSEILLADDGGVTIDVSREASLQMDSAPTNPPTASTNMISLWQLNLVGLRAERYINWVRRRAEAVAFIEDANYV